MSQHMSSVPLASMRRMIIRCLILLFIFQVIIRVFGQLDSHGFLSIDCGLPANTSFVDTDTNLTYVSDEQFCDTGRIANISSAYITDNLLKEYFTVRYFPSGTRNCYTLRSLTVGSKYLLRGKFYYANYDNLHKPPIFDIYLGVNFWYTVNTSYPSYPEIILMVATDYLEVCLVNSGSGNPFITSLHLRQLKGSFPYVYSSQSQILVWRYNLGASNLQLVRYPNDTNDRWWWNFTSPGWAEISTNSTINSDSSLQTPPVVLQTAATTSSAQEPLVLYWNSNDKSTEYYAILHFSEIMVSSGQRQVNISVNVSSGQRKLDISANGHLLSTSYIPSLLSSYWLNCTLTGFTNYNISVVASSGTTLPPILNAIELYILSPLGVLTNADDVAAINGIKEYYKIKKYWSGDPCLPTTFSWTGINCNTNSNITRIIGLNLASSGLTGPLSDYFGNLNALVSLDLSRNDLSGSLPNSLDNLTALTYLDIRGNSKILTTLPPGLQRKQQEGRLTFRFGDINRTPSASSKKKVTAIAVVVALLVIAVATGTILWMKRKSVPKQHKNDKWSPTKNDHAEDFSDNRDGKPQPSGAEQTLPNFEICKFSYKDLNRITTGFKNKIGTGGFGSVYLGILKNGCEVAVKVLSQSSHQGVKEFLAEAENLARIHHKNLVSLMGYCVDKNYMALVYEYMKEGNLYDKLKDNERPLPWKQRLQIAYESALGLEYLHEACDPPLIHRDVKTTNILLGANFEAKISDFGLSRAFDSEAITHVSTRVVGTPGYLDPEYYSFSHLSMKSDVFSFGVVLLEIITGRPPIVIGLEGGNLVGWVDQNLDVDNTKSIVDPKMQDKYEIHSVCKVIDLARRCTLHVSSKRPTMKAIVAELKESLDLEMSTQETHIDKTDDNHLVTDMTQDSTFEMQT